VAAANGDIREDVLIDENNEDANRFMF